MNGDPLVGALAEVGRRYGGSDAEPVPVEQRGSRPGPGAVLVRCGPVVVKAHAVGTDPKALAARLAAAARSALSHVLLTPLEPGLIVVRERLVSVWPYGRTVTVDPARVPWAEAGTLLARLHTAASRELAGLPTCGAPGRLASVVQALRARSPEGAQDAASTVVAAWRALPAWARRGGPVPGPVAVVHGDWHLGQLVSLEDTGWRLIDIDDLGIGAPVWDFARLAALRALEVVREDEFRWFLDAYWAAGGPVLCPGSGTTGDPNGWATLDQVARAAVVAMAAKRLAYPGRELPDALDEDLLRVCARLAEAAA